MFAKVQRRLAFIVIAVLIIGLLPSLGGTLPSAHAQCPSNKYTGTFFNSTNLTGAAAAIVCNDVIDFNWSVGAPVNGVGVDNFSARWTSVQVLGTPGTYVFTAVVEDGARLSVNGVTIIDSFGDAGSPRVLTGAFTTNAANTTISIVFDYVTFVGNSQVQLTFGLSGSVPSGGGGESWFVEYFNNLTWSGGAVATELAPADGINRNYGQSNPAAGVIADGWSSRWTRGVTFPAGTYTFVLRADDGAKLRIDGNEVLNQAQFSNGVNFTTTVGLSTGRHVLSVEHFDTVDIAYLFLTWTPAVGTTLSAGTSTTGVIINSGSTSGATGVIFTPGSGFVPGSAVATVSTSALFFRPAPSTSSGVITTLRRNEQYAAIGRTADNVWVQLQVQGSTGWSMSQFLALNTAITNLPITDGGSAVITTTSPTGVFAQSRAFMKIRSGPGTGFSRVGGIPPNSVVAVLGISADGSWLLINANGVQGWSAAGFYNIIQGNLSSVPVTQG